MVAAKLITRQLRAEAIASSMLWAAIFAVRFGGFGPAQVAIALVGAAHKSASRNEGPGATFQFALPMHQEHVS